MPWTSVRPMPGMEKMLSTISEPTSRNARIGPITVTTGIMAFLSRWRRTSTNSRSSLGPGRAHEVLPTDVENAGAGDAGQQRRLIQAKRQDRQNVLLGLTPTAGRNEMQRQGKNDDHHEPEHKRWHAGENRAKRKRGVVDRRVLTCGGDDPHRYAHTDRNKCGEEVFFFNVPATAE